MASERPPGVGLMTIGAIIAGVLFVFVNKWSENCYYFANTTPVIGTRCPISGFAYKAFWVTALIFFAQGLFAYYQSTRKDETAEEEQDQFSAVPAVSDDPRHAASPAHDLVAQAAMEKYGIVADGHGYLVGERRFDTLVDAVNFAGSGKSEPG